MSYIPPVHSIVLAMPGEGATTLFTITDSTTGAVVAAVQMNHSERRGAAFKQLYVDNRYRNKGYGRALLCAAEKAARLSGCETLSCTCNKSNLVAQGFYKQTGFALVHQFEDGDLMYSRPVMKEAAAS